MRLILAALTATAALLALEISTASAQPGGTRNPYCLRDGAMGRGTWDCSFHTWQQCLASQQGNGGTCVRNPWYDGGRRGSRR